jgi:hypothetical protein
MPGSGGLGICTALCEDAGQAAEVAACGPSATCLTPDPDTDGMCTLACDADAALGSATACANHQICTSWSVWREGETAGCVPFCADEAGCGPYHDCDLRTGACVAVGRVEKRNAQQDGQVCDPSARDDEGRSTDCAGDCLPVPTGGYLCGSYVDRSRTETCPDASDRMKPVGDDADNMGLCIVRDCDGNCPDGTTCQECPFQRGDCCVPG